MHVLFDWTWFTKHVGPGIPIWFVPGKSSFLGQPVKGKHPIHSSVHLYLQLLTMRETPIAEPSFLIAKFKRAYPISAADIKPM